MVISKEKEEEMECLEEKLIRAKNEHKSISKKIIQLKDLNWHGGQYGKLKESMECWHGQSEVYNRNVWLTDFQLDQPNKSSIAIDYLDKIKLSFEFRRFSEEYVSQEAQNDIYFNDFIDKILFSVYGRIKHYENLDKDTIYKVMIVKVDEDRKRDGAQIRLSFKLLNDKELIIESVEMISKPTIEY